MCRKQTLVGRRTLVHMLAIDERTILEGRINHDVIESLPQAFGQTVRDTETPILRVIRGTIRNYIGLFRQRIQVLFELSQRHALAHRYTVVQHVKVGGREIDDLPAAPVANIGIANVPFPWYGPVEDVGPRRYLMDVDIDMALNVPERLPHTPPPDTCGKFEKL